MATGGGGQPRPHLERGTDVSDNWCGLCFGRASATGVSIIEWTRAA